MGALIGTIIGFLLTLLVFSYILGDNPLFRVTIHLFIGVATGYASAVALREIIIPKLLIPVTQVFSGGSFTTLLLGLPPLLFGLLLMAKLSTRFAWLGNPTMAFLVGVGAAAAIGGAVLGTLFPQATATINMLDLKAAQTIGTPIEEQFLDGSIILVGTVTTLMYFHFSARRSPNQAQYRPRWIEAAAGLGQVFIAVTFGVLFAGVYVSALTALVERLDFLWNFIRGFL